MIRVLTCGVLVTDGRHLLIGHATRSPRWDIPKGQAEAGEPPGEAALRELGEETGLRPPPDALIPAGEYRYLPKKDLALFVLDVSAMPDPAGLACSSTFQLGGHALPEFDRFACPVWAEAVSKLGKSMQTVLVPLARGRGWLAR